jgi:hypothetical protein
MQNTIEEKSAYNCGCNKITNLKPICYMNFSKIPNGILIAHRLPGMKRGISC